MISFEERTTNKHGSVVYRTVEMNYVQTIQSSPKPAMVKAYIQKWLYVVHQYVKDPDPKKQYTTMDVDKLIGERGYYAAYRLVEHKILPYEEGQRLYRVFRAIDDHMLDRMREHYKRHEFAEPPAGTKIDKAPFTPYPTLYFKHNDQLLSERQGKQQLLLVAPLILSWEYSEYSRTTRYTVFLPNGMALVQSGWEKAANRFKDPIKRHAQAIEKTARLAALTDWEMVERGELSNAQQRRLSKLILAEFKEGWS